MNTDYDDVLRHALHAAAESVEPSGDGLERIRERLGRPQMLSFASAAAWYSDIALRVTARAEPAIASFLSFFWSMVDRFRPLTAGPGHARPRLGWLRPLAAMGTAIFVVAAGAFAIMTLPQGFSPSSSITQGGGGQRIGARHGSGGAKAHGATPLHLPGGSPGGSSPGGSGRRAASRCSKVKSPRTASPTTSASPSGSSSPSPTSTTSPTGSPSVSPSPTTDPSPSTSVSSTPSQGSAGTPTASGISGLSGKTATASNPSLTAPRKSGLRPSKSSSGPPSPCSSGKAKAKDSPQALGEGGLTALRAAVPGAVQHDLASPADPAKLS